MHAPPTHLCLSIKRQPRKLSSDFSSFCNTTPASPPLTPSRANVTVAVSCRPLSDGQVLGLDWEAWPRAVVNPHCRALGAASLETARDGRAFGFGLHDNRRRGRAAKLAGPRQFCTRGAAALLTEQHHQDTVIVSLLLPFAFFGSLSLSISDDEKTNAQYYLNIIDVKKVTKISDPTTNPPACYAAAVSRRPMLTRDPLDRHRRTLYEPDRHHVCQGPQRALQHSVLCQCRLVHVQARRGSARAASTQEAV